MFRIYIWEDCLSIYGTGTNINYTVCRCNMNDKHTWLYAYFSNEAFQAAKSGLKYFFNTLIFLFTILIFLTYKTVFQNCFLSFYFLVDREAALQEREGIKEIVLYFWILSICVMYRPLARLFFLLYSNKINCLLFLNIEFLCLGQTLGPIILLIYSKVTK